MPLQCKYDWQEGSTRVEEKRALAGLRQSLGYQHQGDNNLPLRRNSCPSPCNAPPAWFLSKILINSNLYFHTALAVWICKCLFNAPETPSTLSKHMALYKGSRIWNAGRASRHSPHGLAAVLPKANKVGPVCRRQASATSHHLPGLWAQSVNTERQLPLTMGGIATLPRGRWQQRGTVCGKKMWNCCKFQMQRLLCLLTAKWAYSRDGFCLATVTIRRIYIE